MSTSSLPSISDLVRDGEAAFVCGDTFVARSQFRAATEQDPTCARAWLGLSRVTPMLRERQVYLQKAVALAPDFGDAQADLLDVEQLLSQGIQVVVSTRKSGPPAPDKDIAVSTATAEPAHGTTFCAKHPTRETGLHCISCMQPICAQCARPAPVGHLCQHCVRQRRPINYQVKTIHLVLGALIAVSVSFLLASLLSFVLQGFYGFYVAFAAAPFAGGGVVAVIDRVTRAKRGRSMQLTVGGAIVLGMLPVVLLGRVALLLLQIGFSNPAFAAILQEEGMSIWMLMLSGIDPAMIILMVLTSISAMYRLR